MTIDVRVGRPALLWIVILWAMLVGGGLFQLYQYGNAAGTGAMAPLQWPRQGGLDRVPDLPTLLVFVHPHCPCSQATIGELERLTARLRSRLSATVVFLHPDVLAADWHRTGLWMRARTIPEVRVIDDVGCVVTRRFGATTSGQVLLYGVSGRLAFSGGITPARGHSGDNPGSDAVLSLAARAFRPAEASPVTCRVFGCPLFDQTVIDSMTESGA